MSRRGHIFLSCIFSPFSIRTLCRSGARQRTARDLWGHVECECDEVGIWLLPKVIGEAALTQNMGPRAACVLPNFAWRCTGGFRPLGFLPAQTLSVFCLASVCGFGQQCLHFLLGARALRAPNKASSLATSLCFCLTRWRFLFAALDRGSPKPCDATSCSCLGWCLAPCGPGVCVCV